MISKRAYHIHRSKKTGKVIAKFAGSVLYNKTPDENKFICFVQKVTHTIHVVKVEDIELMNTFESIVDIKY